MAARREIGSVKFHGAWGNRGRILEITFVMIFETLTGGETVRNTVLRAGILAIAMAGMASGGWSAGSATFPAVSVAEVQGMDRVPADRWKAHLNSVGLMGGFGGKTVLHKPFQATFTVTHTESQNNSLQNNSITNTTTGTRLRAVMMAARIAT